MADAPQQPQLPQDPQHEVLAALGEHTDRLDRLTDLTGQHDELLAQLREMVESLLPDNAGMGHQPIPAPQWHQLGGDEREAAIGRIADWVTRVYRPVYGHLASGLGECWAEHPLALVLLDHMSETWSVLYARSTRPQRVLSAQLEFQIRYVPAAAEMLRAETSGCGHGQRRPRVAAS